MTVSGIAAGLDHAIEQGDAAGYVSRSEPILSAGDLPRVEPDYPASALAVAGTGILGI
jgi:hypothetical protein